MKKLTLKCSMLLMAGILFSCVNIFAANTYTLSYNLKKGDTFTQTSVMEMKTEMDMSGQKMEMSMTLEFSTTMEVVGIENGVYQLKCGYKRFKMASNLPMGQMNFDSEKPETEGQFAEMSKMFERLTKENFTVKMDKFGKMLEITDFDKFMNVIAINGGALQEQFSEENFKQQFSSFQNAFPEKPIAVGETWESQLPWISGLSLPNASEVKMTNTLKSVNGDVAVIESVAAIDVNSDMPMPNGEQENAQNMKMIITGNVTMIHNINLKNGMLKDGTSTMDMDAKIDMAGNVTSFKVSGQTVVKSE